MIGIIISWLRMRQRPVQMSGIGTEIDHQRGFRMDKWWFADHIIVTLQSVNRVPEKGPAIYWKDYQCGDHDLRPERTIVFAHFVTKASDGHIASWKERIVLFRQRECPERNAKMGGGPEQGARKQYPLRWETRLCILWGRTFQVTLIHNGCALKIE